MGVGGELIRLLTHTRVKADSVKPIISLSEAESQVRFSLKTDSNTTNKNKNKMCMLVQIQPIPQGVVADR